MILRSDFIFDHLGGKQIIISFYLNPNQVTTAVMLFSLLEYKSLDHTTVLWSRGTFWWYISCLIAASPPVWEFGAIDISDRFSVSGARGDVAPMKTDERGNMVAKHKVYYLWRIIDGRNNQTSFAQLKPHAQTERETSIWN